MATRDLLFQLLHPEIAFSLIVGERHFGIFEKPESFGFIAG